MRYDGEKNQQKNEKKNEEKMLTFREERSIIVQHDIRRNDIHQSPGVY